MKRTLLQVFKSNTDLALSPLELQGVEDQPPCNVEKRMTPKQSAESEFATTFLDWLGLNPQRTLSRVDCTLITFQSQEVTYAELTMPRNKGYAPMRAKSIESPINSFKTGATVERPMPPPRYTAPPSRTAETMFHSSPAPDRQSTVEMPLVSTRYKNVAVFLPTVSRTHKQSTFSYLY